MAGEYSRIDMNTLLDPENAYSPPPSFYKTLIRRMQILFNAGDINDGINDMPALIGESTRPYSDRFKNMDITKNTPSFIPLFE